MSLFKQTRLRANRLSTKPSFLHLQPCQARRHLSVSGIAKPMIEPTLLAAHSFLEGIHATTGLPWIVTIPLAALLIRSVVVAPLLIYTRRVQIRRLALQPLLQAWSHQIRRQVLDQARNEPLLPNELDRRFKKVMRRKQREVLKRWKSESWRTLPALGQLPVFLAVIETIRRMTGRTGGLFGLLMKQDDTPVDASRDEVLENVKPTGSDLIPIEESLSSEGGLWFHDLLAPDPMLLLPFILSGVVYTNVYLGSRRQSSMAPPSTFTRRLTTSLKVGALFMAPLALPLPSAILVYWISSSTFAACQNALIDRYMPLDSALPSIGEEKDDKT